MFPKDIAGYYESVNSSPTPSDYERYLSTSKLLSCQKNLEDLSTHDEMQFLIIHQTEELLLKLIAFTLGEINSYLVKKDTNRVISLFHRVHHTQRSLLSLIENLETMSPKEYLTIRLNLGNGSGRTSPGFKILIKMPESLWKNYSENYLIAPQLTIKDIYDTSYNHGDSYIVAEAMLEFDALCQRFFKYHFELIARTIGSQAKSLKGNDVQRLRHREDHQFFPELWEVRSEMTNLWGNEYGYTRNSIGDDKKE